MEKPLIVLGSAHKHGDTHQLVEAVFQNNAYDLIDLLDWPVAPYSYEETHPKTDAFLLLVQQLLQHQRIVLATPVYWYSMSGPLKLFFDRLTDLTASHKALGRQLAGRRIFLLASGSDPALPTGFEVPFQLTAAYFNMTFAGSFYQSTKQPYAAAEAQSFVSRMHETPLR